MATVNTTAKTSQASMMERGMAGQRLPLRIGALSGFAGSLGIIAIVTVLLVVNNVELFAAPRLIASVMLGTDTAGAFPIFLGTVVHLITGTALGALFAAVMPPIYRVIWIVAGMIYGILAALFSMFVVLPLFVPNIMAAQASIGLLIIGHVVYGFVLGTLGGTYGLYWGPRNNS
ncbi:MAG: hypothetical protein AAF125_00865 [Chloroflexota bacterium]